MTEEFLDLTDAGLDETFEPTVKAAGEEYKLRVVSTLMDVDKNGVKYFMPFFEVSDDPYCKEFGKYMPLPNKEEMNEKELNKARLDVNAFCDAFGIDRSRAINLKEDVVGREGWAILGIGKDQDGQPINKINKFVAGS